MIRRIGSAALWRVFRSLGRHVQMESERVTSNSRRGSYGRLAVLCSVVGGSLLLVMIQQPIGQDPGYHKFADARTFFGIPNFLNLASNLGFLIAGTAGIWVSRVKNAGRLRSSWLVLFIGITFVSVGSGYYHFDPNNESLVWDRLPMTVGFMGLFVAILGEYMDERLRWLLAPALVVGAGSVFYWYVYEDLRLYIWVQLIPLLAIPTLIALYRPKYSHQWLLFTALGLYILAKAAEVYDKEIFSATRELTGGHAVKHVLSALGCFAIVLMLRERSLLPCENAKSVGSLKGDGQQVPAVANPA